MQCIFPTKSNSFLFLHQVLTTVLCQGDHGLESFTGKIKKKPKFAQLKNWLKSTIWTKAFIFSS